MAASVAGVEDVLRGATPGALSGRVKAGIAEAASKKASPKAVTNRDTQSTVKKLFINIAGRSAVSY